MTVKTRTSIVILPLMELSGANTSFTVHCVSCLSFSHPHRKPVGERLHVTDEETEVKDPACSPMAPKWRAEIQSKTPPASLDPALKFRVHPARSFGDVAYKYTLRCKHRYTDQRHAKHHYW